MVGLVLNDATAAMLQQLNALYQVLRQLSTCEYCIKTAYLTPLFLHLGMKQ